MYLKNIFTVIICFIFLVSCGGNVGFQSQEEEIEEVEVPPNKVILLLDLSGSMKGTPIKKLKKFAHEMIDSTLKYNAEIAIRGFDSSCERPFSIQKAFTQDSAKLHECINTLEAHGSTPLVEAIDKTIDYALETTAEDEHVIIYLVSDGKPSCGDLKTKIDEFIAYKRIIFYVVGYGISKLSEFATQLKKLASSSGGEYAWMAVGVSIVAFSTYQQHRVLRQRNEPYVRRTVPSQISNGDSRYQNVNSRKSSSGKGK